MQKKNIEILKELRNNARIKLMDIARKMEIPQSTVYDNASKAEVYITRYTALLNFSKLGYNSHIHFIIKSGSPELFDYLVEHPNVNSLSRVMEGNFVGEGMFKDLAESELFIKNLRFDYDADVDRFSVIEELKREGIMKD